MPCDADLYRLDKSSDESLCIEWLSIWQKLHMASGGIHNPGPSSLAYLQGRHVLLAEDNLINQTVAKKVLMSLGMVCEVASDGQEAVEAIKTAAQGPRMFDLVLMDMAMPVMGGVTATEVGVPLSPFCLSTIELSLV